MRELKLSNHEQLFNISIIRSYDPTEFSKAFDKIDHNILIRKVAGVSVDGSLLRWFESYVVDRTQAIVY